MQYPFIQSVNKGEQPDVKFGQLPEYLQTFFKTLWQQGLVIEVYGAKSRTWQPVNQRNYCFTSNNYYRLCGRVDCSLQKPNKTSKETGRWVWVTDPTAQPENTVAYMSDGYALTAQIVPY